MKRLYILRHAKSDWADPRLDDHDRPLTARGRRAAALLAAHCRRARVRPRVILCSTAERARQTLAAVMPRSGRQVRVDFLADLYNGDVQAYLRPVRMLEAAVESAMIIGHNPNVQGLILALARSGDALDRVRAKVPTGALATIEFDVEDWDAVRRGTGRLAAFVVPRDLQADAQEP
jgi:phosphohistidine phosphatase